MLLQRTIARLFYYAIAKDCAEQHASAEETSWTERLNVRFGVLMSGCISLYSLRKKTGYHFDAEHTGGRLCWMMRPILRCPAEERGLAWSVPRIICPNFAIHLRIVSATCATPSPCNSAHS
jgi:hypothetical protein